mmetsp:Transcript_4802/g.13575  ORF Transcript_4802/g.13575 Transcript_4802/m.13575 type:complete len:275 (-) Transcript_4802:2406-3230(-)
MAGRAPRAIWTRSRPPRLPRPSAEQGARVEARGTSELPTRRRRSPRRTRRSRRRNRLPPPRAPPRPLRPRRSSRRLLPSHRAPGSIQMPPRSWILPSRPPTSGSSSGTSSSVAVGATRNRPASILTGRTSLPAGEGPSTASRARTTSRARKTSGNSARLPTAGTREVPGRFGSCARPKKRRSKPSSRPSVWPKRSARRRRPPPRGSAWRRRPSARPSAGRPRRGTLPLRLPRRRSVLQRRPLLKQSARQPRRRSVLPRRPRRPRRPQRRRMRPD